MPKLRKDAAAGALSSFRVSEWSVRRKVVAVLALPVILAAVFGGLRVRTELVSASDYSTNQQQATVLAPAIAYLDATERLALPSSLADSMADTDPTNAYTVALAGLKRAAGSANLTAAQKANVADLILVGEQLKTGSGTGSTGTAPVQLDEMATDVTRLITSTLDTNGAPDPRTAALIETVNARLSLVKQQLLIQGATQSAASLLDSIWLAAEIGVEGQALQSVQGNTTGGRRVNNLIAANGTRLGQATTEKAASLGAQPKTFRTYDALSASLLTKIDANLADSAAAAKKRAITDSAVILLALLASLLLALLIAGALIRPLRKLRAGAHEVAHEKLPETVRRIRNGQEPDEITPIPVQTHEELGQLARAVDDMHRQAVTLATGEAQLRSQVGAMFVTLSRRNTTLVNQQLALIESLEQDEEDPQRLEQLFALDHLATRMRRTAESLVILGGTSGRAASFEELSVSDIVHAAVSEVQDYQRVRIDAAPERMVSGRVASDVVHLMAELIDNALSYSPPGSPVQIQASEDNGKVEIEIIDSGLGMAGDALAKANESLKRGGEVTVDTARRMGLFVVSRLAEEHGLKVKLRRNANGGGIIATITLPAEVLVSGEPVEHVSILDAPVPAEEPEVVVEVEPDEEYDPYLERIEEAIAAVTGLPRRRPGQNVNAPEPVATPAAAVSMFEAAPELPAGYEPTPLPGMSDPESSSGSEESGPIALPAPVGADAVSDALSGDLPAELDDEPLADVVTADFGGRDSRDPRPAASLVAVEDLEDLEPVGEPVDEPVDAEGATDYVSVDSDVDSDVDSGDDSADWADAEPAVVAELSDADDAADEVTTEPEPAFPVAGAGWQAAVAAASDAHHTEEPVTEAPAQPVAPVAPAASWDAPAPAAEDEEVARLEPVEALDHAVRLQIRRPLDATPAASALDGEHVPEDTGEASPIFGQLRSNWLNEETETTWSPTEVDRGWSAAEQAEQTETGDDVDTTPSGLPVRRPGGRLVPGGVGAEPTDSVVRDPEEIRNRLAAHAAGVSRGRAAAAAQPMKDDYAHEETGPA